MAAAIERDEKPAPYAGLDADPGARMEARKETATGTETEAGAWRRCAVTRQSRPRAELIRFVIGPEGAPVPDLAERLPGRGIWVTAERAILERAVARNHFARSARRQVAVPADLAERTAALAARRAAELLGLANRAGRVTAGFEKVRARLRGEGPPGLLITAADAAADGAEKLGRLARARGWGQAEGLTAVAMGPVLGRAQAVHLAVEPGPLADRLVVALRRARGLAVAPE